MSTRYSHVLASVVATDQSNFAVTVPADWLQGRTVFGGMQMALATRCMRAVMPSQSSALPLRSAQMTFVGPLLGGTPIRIRAETLRSGKSTVHVRSDLVHDDGKLACTVVGIFGGPRQSRFAREMRRPAPARSADQSTDIMASPALAPAFLQHFDARIAEGAPPYTGYPEPRSLIHARLRDTDCSAEDALLALSDVIPTPVLATFDAPTPASSVNWMIEILRDPAGLDLRDWVLIDTEVRAGSGGYLSQTSVLYGADGVACSVNHQTVAVFG